LGAGLLLVLAAFRHNYAEKLALAEHVKQYQRMRLLFDGTAEHVRRALRRGDLAAARALLFELGREALAESGDWVLLHRERPLEVPRAG
jgi:hypothetical protein